MIRDDNMPETRVIINDVSVLADSHRLAFDLVCDSECPYLHHT